MKTLPFYFGLLLGGFALGQNVGIGTPTPMEKLDVRGNLQVARDMPADGNQSYIHVTWRNTSINQAWRAYLGDPDGGNGVQPNSWEVWEYPAGGTPACCVPRFRILTSKGQTNPPAQFVIGPTGNVGIGTLAPAQRLHVVGVIRSDALSGAHPSPQTYSNVGANTNGDLVRVNPTHGYLFSLTQVCDLTREGTVQAQISGGTLTIDVYDEGGTFIKNCLTLSGVANARIGVLIVNDDVANCPSPARVAGVRQLTVVNGGVPQSVSTDLGCYGSDGNHMVFFVHYNPL